MLFSSPEFVFGFLPVSFLGAILFSKINSRTRNIWLILCSLFFYGYWKMSYLPILLISITVNFLITQSIQSDLENNGAESKKSFRLMVFGIVLNLALLGFYKYTNFFSSIVNNVGGTDIPMLDYALPLAISFFTFQQIAYLVDARKGLILRDTFANYVLFVTFFPQFIAGPIVHHKEMMPQFSRAASAIFRWQHLYVGLFIFAIGLFKKVVIADTFAIYADQGYAAVESMSFRDAWVTTFSYTLQLYFDFSGYSDMAIGLARMFGIRLPINFFSPYKATSIQEFWRRWHITLSRFLRDYIYIPLGGNRRGEARVSLNLFVTFLLGGFWHGAGWTFVFWGALHGIALVISRLFSHLSIPLPRLLTWAATFAVVHIGWIFFRAEDLQQSFDVLRIFLGLDPTALAGPKYVVIENGSEALRQVAFALIVVFALPNSIQFSRNPRPFWKAIFVGLLFGAALIGMLMSRSEVFLYFNF